MQMELYTFSSQHVI